MRQRIILWLLAKFIGHEDSVGVDRTMGDRVVVVTYDLGITDEALESVARQIERLRKLGFIDDGIFLRTGIRVHLLAR